MRSLLSLILVASSVLPCWSVGGSKQKEDRKPVRFAIHHADPWAVKTLIEGGTLTQPEISSILGISGGQGRNTGSGQRKSALLADGFLIVNPTDNSLWWYPNKS